MDKRNLVKEAADRSHLAGEFQKEGELYESLDDRILQNLARQLDGLNQPEKEEDDS